MGPIVYICVGLPGSGKSTHAKVVELISHFSSRPSDQIVRINQDAHLGNRQATNDKAIWALIRGHSIIVDRCNVSRSQRKYWIDLAKVHGARVVVETFKVDPKTCLERVNGRKGHETMTDPAKFKAIVYGFRTTWQDPAFDEGIDEINIRNSSGKISYKLAPTPPKRNLWFYVKALWSML